MRNAPLRLTFWNLDVTVLSLEERAPDAGHRLEQLPNYDAIDVLGHIILCHKGLSCPV